MEVNNMGAAVPIRNVNDINTFLQHFKTKHEYRNFVMVTLGIYTALRISDILSLKLSDVFNLKNRNVLKQITLTEKKTGKTKTIALNKKAVAALRLLTPSSSQDTPLILNERTGRAITREHAFRIISNAAKEIGLAFKVSCHSLRKTFGYFAWKTGSSPVVIMEIFNHSSYSVTKRYLGITQDEIDFVYLNLRI